MKKGWEIRRLGEVCEIIKGRKPTLKAAQSRGDLPYLVAKVMRGSAEAEYASVEDRNSVVVEDSDTIIICDGSNSGEVFTGFHGILSSTMGKISTKAEVDSDYLRAFLASTFEVFNGAKTGTAIPHLDKEALYQLNFPYPQLAEQRRIVRLLDEALASLATATANTKKNLASARAIFDGTLDAAMTGRIRNRSEVEPEAEPATALLQRILSKRRAAQPQRRGYEEPCGPEIKPLPKLPERWTYATVEQLLRDDGGLSYGILKPGSFDPAGVPMIRVMDIGHGRLNETEIFKVTRKLSDEFRRTILEEGDIMLAVMATVGRCAIVPPHLVGANVNRALAVLKLNKDVRSRFVLYAILSPRIQRLFQKNKVGAAQPRINLKELRRYAIPLPPLMEQDHIVETLDIISAETQRLESLYERKLAALTALKKALLHQAFGGGL